MAPHKVLGVPKSATREVVKGAYRRLALACHPDRHPGDRLAKGRWLTVSAAYEEYRRMWAEEDAAKANPARAPEVPPEPTIVDETVSQVKDVSLPFATGMIGIGAEFLKALIGKRSPGGVVSEIAGKAGQAAIDEAAKKARAKVDEVLKKD